MQLFVILDRLQFEKAVFCLLYAVCVRLEFSTSFSLQGLWVVMI